MSILVQQALILSVIVKNMLFNNHHFAANRFKLSSLFEIRPQGSIKQYTVNIKNRHRKKRRHSTIKLEATGKNTNTRKHTKKVKIHKNLIQILYNTILNL